MEILYLLMPISFVLIVLAVLAFRWAIKHRQFDDLNSPAMIPLVDEKLEERVQK
ncbi:MAG: cbb3-type cytochrome oxidase assembly protein CcoS [Cardiobacteriaceae bacterium]|nr:cbb3-type cytochrome oxidase assembly protein CcoS [Cardiobacteriaceae bacterium]